MDGGSKRRAELLNKRAPPVQKRAELAALTRGLLLYLVARALPPNGPSAHPRPYVRLTRRAPIPPRPPNPPTAPIPRASALTPLSVPYAFGAD